MRASSQQKISESAVQHFQTDGVAMLKGALSPDELKVISDIFDYKLARHSTTAFVIPSEGGGVFLTDASDPELTSTPQFSALIEKTPIVDMAAHFMSPGSIWFYYEQLFHKYGSGPARRTPWHQDTSYVPVEGPDIVRFWICLDAVDKEHSLEFVRGSHHGQLYNGSSFNPDDDTAPLYAQGEMPVLPDIQKARDQWDIVSWAVEPGDVLAFHPSMLHGGAATPAGKQRRSLSLVFFGENAFFAPRPSGIVEATAEKSELPVDLYLDLEAGDPFRLAGLAKVR